MKGSGVGLYGRPRPVPLAPTSSEKGFFIGGGERQFMGGSSENCYFHAGWSLPTLSMPACLNQGGEGKKDGCEQGRLAYQSQRSLLSGSSLPFIKKYVLVRRWGTIGLPLAREQGRKHAFASRAIGPHDALRRQ